MSLGAKAYRLAMDLARSNYLEGVEEGSNGDTPKLVKLQERTKRRQKILLDHLRKIDGEDPTT